MAATEAGREAASAMRRRQVEVLIDDVRAFDEKPPDLPPPWVEAAGIGDLLVRLTPQALDELWARFYAHLDELVVRDAEDPDARPVSIVVAGFPREDKA
jgi:hypothetical protein